MIKIERLQKEFLAELKKLGKPIVLVLFNGRPLTLTWENENMDAILEAWWPGTRCRRGTKADPDLGSKPPDRSAHPEHRRIDRADSSEPRRDSA